MSIANRGGLFSICFWDKELIGTIRFSLEKIDIIVGRADITIVRVDIFHLREE